MSIHGGPALFAGALSAACLGLAVLLAAPASRLSEGIRWNAATEGARAFKPASWPLISSVALVVPVIWSRAGALGTALAVAALAALTRHRRRRRRHQQRAHLERDVVLLCHELAADLAAGLSPDRSLSRLGDQRRPTGDLVAQVCAAGRLGADLPAAWREAAAQTSGAHGLLAVAACWQVAERTGASLGRTLAGVATGLADQLERDELIAARLAGAQSTTRLLAALPLAGVVLAWALGADLIGLLLGTGWGRLALSASVALDLLGLWWASQLRSRASRA